MNDTPSYTEAQLAELREAWIKRAKELRTIEEFGRFLEAMIAFEHSYNTAVYAAAALMIGVLRVFDRSPQGGLSGFQAGAVFWELAPHLLSVGKCGLKLVDWELLLYPQYAKHFEKTINNKAWGAVKKRAKEILKTSRSSMHEDVRKHMESIVEGELPFGFTVEKE